MRRKQRIESIHKSNLKNISKKLNKPKKYLFKEWKIFKQNDNSLFLLIGYMHASCSDA